jgi:hypothetical protein
MYKTAHVCSEHARRWSNIMSATCTVLPVLPLGSVTVLIRCQDQSSLLLEPPAYGLSLIPCSFVLQNYGQDLVNCIPQHLASRIDAQVVMAGNCRADQH